jgi:hypothetical protein
VVVVAAVTASTFAELGLVDVSCMLNYFNNNYRII